MVMELSLTAVIIETDVISVFFSNIKMTNCKNNSFTLYINCLVGTLTSTRSSPEAAEKSHGSGGRLVFPKGPHEELGLSWRAAPLLERASTTVPGPHVACWESCCFIFAFMLS